MLVRYANLNGKLRKVYVVRVVRQHTLFGDTKFVSSVSTSKTGSNPVDIESKNLLKERPARSRARKDNYV